MRCYYEQPLISFNQPNIEYQIQQKEAETYTDQPYWKSTYQHSACFPRYPFLADVTSVQREEAAKLVHFETFKQNFCIMFNS